MIKIIQKNRFSTIKQFQIIQEKIIGCGSFGIVKLARHRTTCRMYAVKIIDLKDVPSETEVRLVQRQIKLHSQLDHPHIIKLWDTILDGDKIHMIMEYAEQGNLFFHQNTRQIYSQPEALKYFMQTLEGVRYLHGKDIIHRDLKPQNLLLDVHYNIKICDFGWAGEDIKAKRITFCGTYEYMAPQMLSKTEYDYRIDIWALGILLFQMLHGNAPFKGKTASEVQQSILHGNLQIADYLSDSVRDLLAKMLQFHPEKRPSIEQILKHAWVTDTECFLNNYLKLQKSILPKDIYNKICLIPCRTRIPKQKAVEQTKHRKNNSVNIEESTRNIHINLQINNFAFMVKKGPLKNKYHSQERIQKVDQNYSCPNEDENRETKIKKSKMQGVSKVIVRKESIQHMLQKIKFSKNLKLYKDISSFQREKDPGQASQLRSKKRLKLRKSQVDSLVDKYNNVRFNTEANEEFEIGRLKKSGAKSKLHSNKIMLRMNGKNKLE